MAWQTLSPGTIRRCPKGNSVLCPFAKGTDRGSCGMSGTVSRKPAASITCRAIHAAYSVPLISSIISPSNP